MDRNTSVRRLFPGSNTPEGYHSFYEHILPDPDTGRRYIIKGGPGTGKSTFMQRLARHASRNGHSVEYHHCSADPTSLDAVVVGGVLAVIDGTAPHPVEPRLPGAVDTIFNFGTFWDRAAIADRRDAIADIAADRQLHFRRAFRYLSAAARVRDVVIDTHRACMTAGPLDRIVQGWIDHYLSLRPRHTAGRSRHLFGEAITPQGLIGHLPTILCPVNQRVVLYGPPGTGKAAALHTIAQMAVGRGFFVECFHDPLHPEMIRHVNVPAVPITFTSASTAPSWIRGARASVDTRTFLNERVKAHNGALAQAEHLSSQLFASALQALTRAQSLHGQLEAFYAPHMEYSQLDALYDQVRNDIDMITTTARIG